MKIYTFQVEIKEGSDEFWESITKRCVSGCDEVQILIENSLCSEGFFHLGDNCEVKLSKFEDKSNAFIKI